MGLSAAFRFFFSSLLYSIVVAVSDSNKTAEPNLIIEYEVGSRFGWANSPTVLEQYDSVYVGEPVVFRLLSPYLQEHSTTDCYIATFDFGHNEKKDNHRALFGLGCENSTIFVQNFLSGNGTSMTHVFSEAGLHTVSAIVEADCSRVSEAELDNCINKFATMEAFVRINVKPTRPCYTFSVYKQDSHTSNTTGNQNIGTLVLKANSINEISIVVTSLRHEESQEALTSDFASLGESPVVQILGDIDLLSGGRITLVETNSSESDDRSRVAWFDEMNLQWRFKIKTKNRPSGTVWLKIYPARGPTILGCGIQGIIVPISIERFSYPNGDNQMSISPPFWIAQEIYDNVESYGNKSYGSILAFHHEQCNPDVGIMIVEQFETSTKRIEMLLSNDGFLSFLRLRFDSDLFFINSLKETVPFCSQISCTELEIKQVTISGSRIIFSTNTQVFQLRTNQTSVYEEYSVNNYDDVLYFYNSSAIVNLILEEETDYAWRLFQEQKCLSDNSEVTASEPATLIPPLFIVKLKLEDNSLQQLIVEQGQGLNDVYVPAVFRSTGNIIKSVSFDPTSGNYIFLFSDEVGSVSFVGILDKETQSVSSGYVFSENMKAIESHASGLGYFAISRRSLWISLEGFSYFHRHFDLEVENDEILEVISSPTSTEFLVRTLKGRVYYGRVDEAPVILLLQGSSQRAIIYFDATNSVIMLDAYIFGEIMITRKSIPTQAKLDVYEKLIPYNLVPSCTSGRVWLTLLPTHKNDGLPSEHVGVHDSGKSLVLTAQNNIHLDIINVIKNVDGTSTIYVDTGTDDIKACATERCEFASTSNLYIHTYGIESQTVSLVVGNGGWLPMHIGMTIICQGGSLVVTETFNSTHAKGDIIYELFDSKDSQVIEIPPEYWSLIDMRGESFEICPRGWNQTFLSVHISPENYDNDILEVVVDNASAYNFEFFKEDIGKTVTFSSLGVNNETWGTIVDVLPLEEEEFCTNHTCYLTVAKVKLPFSMNQTTKAGLVVSNMYQALESTGSLFPRVSPVWSITLSSCKREEFCTYPQFYNPQIKVLDLSDVYEMNTYDLIEASMQERGMSKDLEKILGKEKEWKSPFETFPKIFVSSPKSFALSFKILSSVEVRMQKNAGVTSPVDVHGNLFGSGNDKNLNEEMMSSLPTWTSSSSESIEANLVRLFSSGEPGWSSFYVRQPETSLSCNRHKKGTVGRFYFKCPPYKKLVFESPISVTERVRAGDFENIEILPVNYRPPSYRGKAIPLTTHVYNADKSQPLHNSRFQVSRNSAKFKQCANSTEKNCGCTTQQSTSVSLSETDCIKYVSKHPYQRGYVPNLLVLTSEDISLAKKLEYKYRLKELNGRFDFCTNSTNFDLTECGDADAIQDFFFDPLKKDAILFVGEGLYHFEVEVVDGISFCNLSVQFTVFVVSPPLSRIIDATSKSVTAIIMGMIGFGTYAIYSREKPVQRTKEEYQSFKLPQRH